MANWQEIWQENKLQLALAGLGVLVMGIGIYQMAEASKGSKVEIINAETSGETRQEKPLMVDVAGAVEKPGVYSLKPDARILDALAAAGGLSVKADRTFLDRFVNRAEPVKDGMKIYIPEQGGQYPLAEGGQTATGQGGRAGSVAGSEIINVNTASQVELESLNGIGEARALAIIQNRPYSSLEEVVDKAKVPPSVLAKNEGRLSIY